jgi:LmbE family N-acetylglucosaminyl deacetylase
MRPLAALLLCLGALCGCAGGAPESIELARVSAQAQPRILAVIAHPDDESACAAALFVAARHLGGRCDVLVITNGEGGFKYSGLAESYYGSALSREEVGRAELPAIRRREMLESARVLGVARLELLGERDHRYTTDVGEVLGPGAGVWDLARVRERLDRRLAQGDYGFAFALLPTPQTHAHHKAATLLLLDAVARLPLERRPVVLGAAVESGVEQGAYAPEGLQGFPRSALAAPQRFVLERRRPLGYRGALDWQMAVDWVIAAHKSQGTLARSAGRGEREVYLPFAGGPLDALERTARLFERFAAVELPVHDYGPSAGVVPP